MFKKISMILSLLALTAVLGADQPDIQLYNKIYGFNHWKNRAHEEATNVPCNCCKPFGLFFQKNESTLSGNIVSITLDTPVYSSKDIQLDPSGGVILSKPGFYQCSYAINFSSSNSRFIVDAYATLNNSNVIGSSNPFFINNPLTYTIVNSFYVKVCKENSLLQLWLYNPSLSITLLVPDPKIGVVASLNIIYLGGLNCVSTNLCN